MPSGSTPARNCWTREERSVDVHVKRLRETLGEAGAMIETVRGAGYRLTAHLAPRSQAAG